MRLSLVVIVVTCLIGNDIDMLQPLNHPSSDVSWYDETDRISVIRLENLSVRLIGDNNVVGRVHGSSKWDGGSILDRLSPIVRRGMDLVRPCSAGPPRR